ncbi:hypothetical protein C8R44DRAFT_742044 [Mycena epipterygia]|nr:hypothetical protein C8R44DRAFT_742044 [Mycena epipterygia]
MRSQSSGTRITDDGEEYVRGSRDWDSRRNELDAGGWCGTGAAGWLSIADRRHWRDESENEIKERTEARGWRREDACMGGRTNTVKAKAGAQMRRGDGARADERDRGVETHRERKAVTERLWGKGDGRRIAWPYNIATTLPSMADDTEEIRACECLKIQKRSSPISGSLIQSMVRFKAAELSCTRAASSLTVKMNMAHHISLGTKWFNSNTAGNTPAYYFRPSSITLIHALPMGGPTVQLQIQFRPQPAQGGDSMKRTAVELVEIPGDEQASFVFGALFSFGLARCPIIDAEEEEEVIGGKEAQISFPSLNAQRAGRMVWDFIRTAMMARTSSSTIQSRNAPNQESPANRSSGTQPTVEGRGGLISQDARKEAEDKILRSPSECGFRARVSGQRRETTGIMKKKNVQRHPGKLVFERGKREIGVSGGTSEGMSGIRSHLLMSPGSIADAARNEIWWNAHTDFNKEGGPGRPPVHSRTPGSVACQEVERMSGIRRRGRGCSWLRCGGRRGLMHGRCPPGCGRRGSALGDNANMTTAGDILDGRRGEMERMKDAPENTFRRTLIRTDVNFTSEYCNHSVMKAGTGYAEATGNRRDEAHLH